MQYLKFETVLDILQLFETKFKEKSFEDGWLNHLRQRVAFQSRSI